MKCLLCLSENFVNCQTVAVPAGLLGQRPGGALGLSLLLQKPLLRSLQLVYFFTVQFTHRLSLDTKQTGEDLVSGSRPPLKYIFRGGNSLRLSLIICILSYHKSTGNNNRQNGKNNRYPLCRVTIR